MAEVLQPTTIDVDRGPKLDFYKSLPTVRHNLLVYQNQLRVVRCRRGEMGFELEVLTSSGDTLAFEAVDCMLGLAMVYFGVEV